MTDISELMNCISLFSTHSWSSLAFFKKSKHEIGEGRFHTRTLLDNNLATVRLVVIEAVMLTDDGVLHAFDVPQLDVDVDDSLELGDAERLITALIDGIRFGRQLLRDAA